MRKLLAILLFVLFIIQSWAQDGFPYGKATYSELNMNVYDKDTAASAVVLKELGEAFIDNYNDHNLIFRYHVKIKVLKKNGLENGNVTLLLQKQDGRYEKLLKVKASSFNIENGSMKETKLDDKNIFTENYNKYWDAKKFAIPNVQVGTVIEYEYEIETPFFVSNFKPWEFQSDLPKIYSEFCAIIPANYRYNIALKGLLTLDKNESKVLKDWFQPGGSRKADCARYIWAMKDIPAFVEEDYMTAKRNFIAAINFELEQIEYFDGRKDRVTKQWKDAEHELLTSQHFGLQIKRGKDIVDSHVDGLLVNESDPLQKAQKIYEFIRNWYRWDEYTGKYSEFGIKKAFEKKEGNVGDINLSLIAALRYANLNVEPLILATRDKGLPTELYPVLTDFNYVVAKLNIDDKVFLLDATDDFMPFGVLPERCLNGKGRVIGESGSYWHTITPADRAKQLTILVLKLEADGFLRGTIQTTYMGYKGADKRRKIYSFSSTDDYIKDKMKAQGNIEIRNVTFNNLENFSKPLIEKLEVEIQLFDQSMDRPMIFNPFFVERWTRNPFKSTSRSFPVDFGAPLDETFILRLELPDGMTVTEIPARVAVGLPDNGGRFIQQAEFQGKQFSLNSSLLINKPVFSSVEYHYLRELFSQVVAAHQTDVILKKHETK